MHSKKLPDEECNGSNKNYKQIWRGKIIKGLTEMQNKKFPYHADGFNPSFKQTWNFIGMYVIIQSKT